MDSARTSPVELIATQLEYRLVLPWRFGLVAFGGIGGVAPGADKFRTDQFLPAGGTGIRFLLSKKYHVNLRTDFAWGKDNFTWGVVWVKHFSFDAIPLRVRAKEVLNMDPAAITPWRAAWLWSLPLLVVTMVIHAFSLRMIDRRVFFILNGSARNRLLRMASWVIMPVVALCAAILHGTEAAIWAAAYVLLGALPDRKSAMLYSMNAMTTYGHVDLHLEPHWQLMGALEALNGVILFGLTTAFLFTVMQKVWPRLNSST